MHYGSGAMRPGATLVCYHTTPWAIHYVLLVDTSEEHGKWAEGVF